MKPFRVLGATLVCYSLGIAVSAATPITLSAGSSRDLVAVSPSGHGADGPRIKNPNDDFPANLPQFNRGIDPLDVPDGYEVRGNGVVLFRVGDGPRRGGDGPGRGGDGPVGPGDGGAGPGNLFPPDIIGPPAGPLPGTDPIVNQPLAIVTPEPASLILLGSGLVTVYAQRRRRRNSQ